MKELALDAGLPVLQPERLKDPAFLDAFAALGADLGVVAAYGRIIPEVVINTPRLGLINVHGSLLPRYRGAAPIQRAVMAGEPETGVTIMRIVKELDAGAMFAKARAADPARRDQRRHRARARALWARACSSRSSTRIAAGTAREEPQDDCAGDLRAEDHARGEPHRLDAVGGTRSTTRCAASTRGRGRRPRSTARG